MGLTVPAQEVDDHVRVDNYAVSAMPFRTPSIVARSAWPTRR